MEGHIFAGVVRYFPKYDIIADLNMNRCAIYISKLNIKSLIPAF